MEFSTDQLLLIARQHFAAGRNAPAEDLCRQVLRDQPDRAEARELLARMRPDAIAHYNLANKLFEEDRFDEAIAEYGRAIEITPDFAEARSNLGNALTAKRETRGAIAAYESAIRLRPDLVQPRWNRALAALLLGDFETGWDDYELRLRNFSSPSRSAPQWNGEDLSGKTILLWAEQGFGDTIQFVRYFNRVAALAKTVLLEVPPELRRLFARPPDSSLNNVAAAYDFHSSLLSLPRIFKTREDTIPREVPYLTAPPELVRGWRHKLGPAAGKLRVGLAWAGGASHQHDRLRSIAPNQLSPLLRNEDAEFHSLQNTKMNEALDVIDHSRELTDFAETAALIENLDLIISVDTAVAHLAGALAKPTWLLIAFAPDWRWQLDRSDSPWYPTMRLFRQGAIGDWGKTVKQVRRELRIRLPGV